ncbi:MAG: class I SAM-dependent methyltransferase [SAR324 cluster bacterium]|nr:class I SAM-dependent methyltransferase [SAR324 cluster bacterium]
MEDIKFDPKKLAKLNNPERLEMQPPKEMWDLCALKNPDCIVDIGAGTGFFAKEFAKFFSGRVLALDISDIMLGWMCDNLSEVMSGRIQPLKMQEASMPLDESVADLAYMINLHHELHEPHGLLTDCLRILKPGGKVMICDWKAVEMEMGPPLKIRITEDKIKAQLEEAGFKDVQVFDSLPMHSLVIATNPK